MKMWNAAVHFVQLFEYYSIQGDSLHWKILEGVESSLLSKLGVISVCRSMES
jgi:hypothetical protein